MKRRSFMRRVGAGAVAAALAKPALAVPSRERTLIFTPQSDLSILDPIWTPSSSTTHHGFSVFDTLYGVDDAYRPHPQMAEGHRVSDDGRTWFITLRPGLKFHDGEPVLARDCIASLVRWSKRDTFGRTLGTYVDQWDCADDRTLRIRLKSPFPVLPDALAHPMSSAAFIMPERMASVDANTQVTDTVGSGPLRFLRDEFVPGSHVAYARNEAYIPRDEPPQGTSGRKQINFDRVEWQIIPDSSTAAAALQTGEIDWWELASSDLVPMLAKNPRVKLQLSEPLGYLSFLRFNAVIPPFDKPSLRNLILSAIDQSDYMRSASGDYQNAWRTCYSFFPCGLSGIPESGAAIMGGEHDIAALRGKVAGAGYNGEKIVILNAVDYPLRPFGDLTADLLQKLGMNVDLQEIDFTSFQRRRMSKEPVDHGGWNIFHVRGVSAAVVNPAVHVFLSPNYPGWSDVPEIQTLIRTWLESPTDAGRAAAMTAIDTIAFAQAPSVPLGQYFPRTASRYDISGILPGSASVMWNIRRS
jgi:peptide/nickel transport system substrate-binding protein